MKILKTVTKKVIAANQQNSRQSTGPKDLGNVVSNAMKHSLTSRRHAFKNVEDEERFRTLVNQFDREFEPSGPTESVLIEEMALCRCKVEIVDGWLMDELEKERDAAVCIVGAVTHNHLDGKVPLFIKDDGTPSAAKEGWTCNELVIRTGATESNESAERSFDREGKVAQVLVEARLKSRVDLAMRYGAALRRDFYRALAALLAMRHDKIE